MHLRDQERAVTTSSRTPSSRGSMPSTTRSRSPLRGLGGPFAVALIGVGLLAYGSTLYGVLVLLFAVSYAYAQHTRVRDRRGSSHASGHSSAYAHDTYTSSDAYDHRDSSDSCDSSDSSDWSDSSDSSDCGSSSD